MATVLRRIHRMAATTSRSASRAGLCGTSLRRQVEATSTTSKILSWKTAPRFAVEPTPRGKRGFLVADRYLSTVTTSASGNTTNSDDDDSSDSGNVNKRTRIGARPRHLPRRTWEQSFEELKTFLREHGHCRIIRSYKPDPALGKWVRQQIARQGRLPKERKALLDSIGLDWTTQKTRRDQQWQEMFQRLRAYYDEFGHSRVPTRYEEDPSLAIWVSSQRARFKEGRLAQDRQEQLSKIDFEFPLLQSRRRNTPKLDIIWNSYFMALIDFQKGHGHCLVPAEFQENPQLARWVHRQRSMHDEHRLRPDRHARLKALGFVFNVNPYKESWQQEIWDATWEELELYLQEPDTGANFGGGESNTKNSRRFPPPEDTPLGRWVALQQKLYRKGSLDSTRADRLAEIPRWSWGPPTRSEVWKAWLDQVEQYVANNDQCLPTMTTDRSLAMWIARQRRVYRLGKHKWTPQQHAVLERLGVLGVEDEPVVQDDRSTANNFTNEDDDHQGIVPEDEEKEEDEISGS